MCSKNKEGPQHNANSCVILGVLAIPFSDTLRIDKFFYRKTPLNAHEIIVLNMKLSSILNSEL